MWEPETGVMVGTPEKWNARWFRCDKWQEAIEQWKDLVAGGYHPDLANHTGLTFTFGIAKPHDFEKKQELDPKAFGVVTPIKTEPKAAEVPES